MYDTMFIRDYLPWRWRIITLSIPIQKQSFLKRNLKSGGSDLFIRLWIRAFIRDYSPSANISCVSINPWSRSRQIQVDTCLDWRIFEIYQLMLALRIDGRNLIWLAPNEIENILVPTRDIRKSCTVIEG